ncbi:MAG: hypothetical protein HQM10_11640 [Candidatus Riflebacteria bacterium]|nr:hypothetical protein [Candidatus Riflebacteria bacterium]
MSTFSTSDIKCIKDTNICAKDESSVIFAVFFIISSILYACYHPFKVPEFTSADLLPFFTAIGKGIAGFLGCCIFICIIELVGKSLNHFLKISCPPSLDLHIGFTWLLFCSTMLASSGKLNFFFCCLSFFPILGILFLPEKIILSITEIPGKTLLLISVTISLFTAISLSPSIAYDDHVYQMSAIDGFFQSESIWFESSQQNVYRPLAHATFTALIKKVFGEYAARVSSSIFLLMICIILGRIKPFLCGIFAVAALISNPQWVFLSGTYYVEPFLCLLFILAIDSAETIFNSNETHISAKTLFFAGFLWGSLPSAKYSGIYLLLMPFIIAGWRAFSIKLLSGCVCGFALTAFPFYLKNLVSASNLFFPHQLFFYTGIPFTFTERLFQEAGTGDVLVDFGYQDFLNRFGMGRTFPDLLMAPFNVSFFSQFHDKKHALSYFDGQVSIVSFILLVYGIAVLIRLFHQNSSNTLNLVTTSANTIFFKRILVCFVLWILWVKGPHQVRFLMPLVTYSSYLYGKFDIAKLISPGISFTWRHLAVIMMIIPWTFSYAADKAVKTCHVVSGTISEEDYLNRRVPPYRVFKWMENNLPADSKILLLLEERSYFLKLQHYWTDLLPQTFINFLYRCKTAENAARILRKFKITHIMMPVYGWNIYESAVSEPVYNSIFREIFSSRLKMLFNNGQFMIFEWRKS